jgi:hypothetical protein
VRFFFFNSSFILYFQQGLTGLLAAGSLVKQRMDEARMSFVGSHKVNCFPVSLLYLSLILFQR